MEKIDIAEEKMEKNQKTAVQSDNGIKKSKDLFDNLNINIEEEKKQATIRNSIHTKYICRKSFCFSAINLL